MSPDQALCLAVADLLTAQRPADLPATVQILARHAKEEQHRPVLQCLSDATTTPHPKARQGILLLAYLADVDDEDAQSSQDALQAAGDLISSESGKAALRESLQPLGLWLRVLTPSAEAAQEDGDRGRKYELRFRFFLQTAL